MDGPPSQGYGGRVGGAMLVFELWHARGEVLTGDLQGALALLALGGGGPMPRGFLRSAATGDGGTMASGQAGLVGGLVCA